MLLFVKPWYRQIRSFVVRLVLDPSAFVPSPWAGDFPLQKCAVADANHDSRLAIRCPPSGVCFGVQILISAKNMGRNCQIAASRCCLSLTSGCKTR